MLFESKAVAHKHLVRNESYVRHPVTGDVLETIPAIWCDFGTLGQEYTWTNPETGEQMQGADIRGGSYDTEIEAQQNGWDSDIREMVERSLLKLCEREPQRMWVVERETPRAAKPWPTYDEMDADQIVSMAQALGLVAESVQYERENEERPFIIQTLEGAEETPEEPAEAPEPELVTTGKSSKTITL
jgi:hypothetical protein